MGWSRFKFCVVSSPHTVMSFLSALRIQSLVEKNPADLISEYFSSPGCEVVRTANSQGWITMYSLYQKWSYLCKIISALFWFSHLFQLRQLDLK